jgi:hypothetical protein
MQYLVKSSVTDDSGQIVGHPSFSLSSPFLGYVRVGGNTSRTPSSVEISVSASAIMRE